MPGETSPGKPAHPQWAGVRASLQLSQPPGHLLSVDAGKQCPWQAEKPVGLLPKVIAERVGVWGEHTV